MGKLTAALLGALLAGAASGDARAAEPGDFSACDGALPPKPKKSLKPGEKQDAWRGFGGTLPNRAVLVRNLGVAGLAACERALADPVLVPEFWARRASLIRARALHEMSEKNDAGATETLDEVDKLYAENGKGEEIASAKLANDALRAVALYRMKKSVEGEKLLVSINERRPYSPSVRRLTTSIRLLFDTDRSKRLARLREQAPLNPYTLRLMLMLSLQNRDFENTLLYADQISFDLPRGRAGWTMRGEEARAYDQIEQRASLRGARAYALLALGRMEESAHALKAARDEVAEAIEPPAPPANGGKLSKRVVEDHRRRVAAGDEATAVLDDWSRAMAIRMRASKMTMKAIGTDPDRPKGEAMAVMPDLLFQVRGASTGEAADIDKLLEALAAYNDAVLTKALSLSFTSLTSMLPAPEYDGVRPKMRGEGRNIWRTNLEGYRVMGADDPDLGNVRMASLAASPAMVEEAAMLVAADHAASLGKDAFVIESAQMIQRSVTTSGWVGSYTSNSGYEYRLLIRPISIANGEAQSRHWRALKVNEVRAALAAKYPPAK